MAAWCGTRRCPPGGPGGHRRHGTRCVQVGISCTTSESGLRRNGDLTADDLVLERIELIGDVIDETTRGGVADAVDRQVEDLRAGSELALAERVDGVVRGDVDPLQHRRE